MDNHKALEDAVLAIKYADTPVKVGSFQGFDLSVTVNSNMIGGGMSAGLQGATSHTTKLIESFAHNLNRLEAALYNIDGRIERTQDNLAKLRLDHAEAQKIVAEPFPQQEELDTKEQRLKVVTDELNQAAIEAKKNAPKREKTCYFERAKMKRDAARLGKKPKTPKDQTKGRSKKQGIIMANKEKMGPPTLEMIQGNPYNYTFDEVAKCMGEERAKSLFKTLYKNGVSPKNQTMTIKDIYVGGDTTKYAFELQDGYCIETVCIKRRTGNTVCVSTMVGCPVGCIFCASGKNGFIRNLSPAEIVQQIVLLKERVNRIVFMGMGEPLFNYDNLIKSIHILRDRNGLNFPTDGINVSTVGPVEQLKRLREEHLKIQFTLSLHATDQATRNMIMPHMKSNSIHSVVEAALSYSERHNRKITIAYLLAPGINDRASDVRQLGKWFRGKNVLINLLQYNETACKRIKRPNKQQLVAFKIRLEEAGLEVKLRESRGNRIKAACGQLVSDYNKGNDAPTSDSPEKMSPVIHKLSDNKADTTRGIRKEKRHPFAKHKAKRKRKKN